MALLGKAALAMWWDVSAGARPELEHWHAHEHVPERLAIPGFLRATRWTDVDGGEGFFVMYELQDHDVLASPAYVARLNAPTPWSTRMMPLHRHMVRTQCHVLHSRGAVTARHALTIRCAPADGQDHALRQALQHALQHALGGPVTAPSTRPGIVGLHLLRHDAPALAATAEQAIRGHADRAADWVIVACGYDLAALRQVATDDFSADRLQALGAAPQTTHQFFGLASSATPADVH